jgi:hypothetical protein
VLFAVNHEEGERWELSADDPQLLVKLPGGVSGLYKKCNIPVNLLFSTEDAIEYNQLYYDISFILLSVCTVATTAR